MGGFDAGRKRAAASFFRRAISRVRFDFARQYRDDYENETDLTHCCSLHGPWRGRCRAGTASCAQRRFLRKALDRRRGLLPPGGVCGDGLGAGGTGSGHGCGAAAQSRAGTSRSVAFALVPHPLFGRRRRRTAHPPPGGTTGFFAQDLITPIFTVQHRNRFDRLPVNQKAFVNAVILSKFRNVTGRRLFLFLGA